MQNAIQIRNLSFTYNKKKSNVLNNISFDIKKNEYVCIIGHNGSGKSTLSKLIMGLLDRNNGSIHINDVLLNHKNLSEIRKYIGIVFQNPDNQFIGSSVQDDIAFGLENSCVQPKDMQKIIQKVAKIVGISHLLKEEPENLSGGQKQKVAIASVLALNSSIIIFDEATSMLDPRGKVEIKKKMLDLKNTQNKTIISITHDMEEIINADRILVLNKGSLIINGTLDEVISKKALLTKIGLNVPKALQFSQLMQKHYLNFPISCVKKTALKNLEEWVKNNYQSK